MGSAPRLTKLCMGQTEAERRGTWLGANARSHQGTRRKQNCSAPTLLPFSSSKKDETGGPQGKLRSKILDSEFGGRETRAKFFFVCVLF